MTTVTMPLDQFDEMREEIRMLKLCNDALAEERDERKLAMEDKAHLLRTLFPRPTWPVSIRFGLQQDHRLAIEADGTVTDHGRQITEPDPAY